MANFETIFSQHHAYLHTVLINYLVEIKCDYIQSYSEADDDIWNLLLTEVRRNSPDLSIRIAVGQYEY